MSRRSRARPTCCCASRPCPCSASPGAPARPRPRGSPRRCCSRAASTAELDDAPADNAWPTAALLERVLAAARPPGASPSSRRTTSPCARRVRRSPASRTSGPTTSTSTAASRPTSRRSARIVEFQSAGDWVVVNADDAGALELAAGSAAACCAARSPGPRERPRGGGRVRAPDRAARRRVHDLGPVAALPPAPGAENGLLAGACAVLAGASGAAIPRALAGWTGLALRREQLGVVDGSPVIRDALAATPAKAAAGLALHARAASCSSRGRLRRPRRRPHALDAGGAGAVRARGRRSLRAPARTPRSSAPRPAPRRRAAGRRPRERRACTGRSPRPPPTPAPAPRRASRSCSRRGSRRRPAERASVPGLFGL